MAEAKQGDRVKVDYTGKLQDGTIFDSSDGREPLEFTIGGGQVIPDFESALVGMNPGDKKTVQIPATRAYGARRDDLVLEVGRDQFPEDIKPEVGDQLQLRQPDGMSAVVTVTEANDQSVTLDGNHPLAGEDLTFDVELVEVA
ncbi:MAG: peptidylprolyl isomerase [Armatimonadota bacterium]|nr:peptidylprolyl isomerase [bacterium]